MNNPFDYMPTPECDNAYRDLLRRLDALKESRRIEDVNFCRELGDGKMLGVLIAADERGERHTLYAFSGQLGNGGFHREGFVGPVFDYLEPGGYFKRNEAEISRQNVEISLYEKGAVARVRQEYREAKDKLEEEISRYKGACRISKLERDARRESGPISEREKEAMIRQSQFEKAELHRLRKRAAAELEPFAERLENAQSRLIEMKEKRRSDSEALQEWLFSNFKLLNARGESRSLSEIFAGTPMKVPPSGAGECCAPKLLQAAYLRGWRPVAIAEYWYGNPKEGEVRLHGEHYPACRGKCLPVLTWMLRGLDVNPPLATAGLAATTREPEILFENGWFCIVDKPSGMLSVQGKGKAVSVQQWLEERYGKEKGMKVAHRLDQDTSGLLVATFGPVAFKVMQSLFATRMVKKMYVAELEGDYESLGLPQRGCIEVPLSPDWLDRPRQRVDFESGKEAVTYYEFTGVSEGRSRVLFHPLTGRTHQLRVHAASSHGLGMPIAGDRLYGKKGNQGAGRLLLHARKLVFTFPVDGRTYSFESSLPF